MGFFNRTWSLGETVTPAMMNTYRDNFAALAPRTVGVTIGSPDGADLTTGIKQFAYFSFPYRITGWTLLSIDSGSIVIDVIKNTYANHFVTAGSSIAGSEKPTLSSGFKGQDLTLTTWTQDVAAGDVLGFEIQSVSGIKQVSLWLSLEPQPA